MTIPRFNAQFNQISVPRMQDYQYEQNVSLYKTLKAAGERIDNTFFEMVAEGQLGQPNIQENPDYSQAAKNYKDAADYANNHKEDAKAQEYLAQQYKTLQSTPRMIVSWWGKRR